MLPKKERLTSNLFNRFFSSGRRFNTDLWQIVYVPSTKFQAAVVVGKKVEKSAVKRNKIRRQIYNLQYRQSRTDQLTGVYLLLTKPAVKSVSFAKLKEQLHSSLALIEKKSHSG